MNKLIIFCVILAVANALEGETKNDTAKVSAVEESAVVTGDLFRPGDVDHDIPTDVSSFNYNSLYRIDNYVKVNRRYLESVLKDCDSKLEKLEKDYAGRLDVNTVQLTFLSEDINRFQDRVYGLELLSDLNKQCVNKYRAYFPTLANVTTDIESCVATATKQVSVLLKSPKNYRNKVFNEITKFDSGIEFCHTKYYGLSQNLTHCVTSLVEQTDKDVKEFHKQFDYELDAAQCTATTNVKKSIDCSYTTQSKVIALITKSDFWIDSCVTGKDECKPCEAHTCSESYTLSANYKDKTIANPFYGKKTNNGCLMLEVN